MDLLTIGILIAVIVLSNLLIQWSTQKKRRGPVFVLGALLLALAFLFPYTSFPTKQQSEDGRTFTITTKSRFVPIWTALAEHERATLKGNLFDDTLIQWPVVIALAVGIVIWCGLSVHRLRHQDQEVVRPKPSGEDKRRPQETQGIRAEPDAAADGGRDAGF